MTRVENDLKDRGDGACCSKTPHFGNLHFLLYASIVII